MLKEIRTGLFFLQCWMVYDQPLCVISCTTMLYALRARIGRRPLSDVIPIALSDMSANFNHKPENNHLVPHNHHPDVQRIRRHHHDTGAVARH